MSYYYRRRYYHPKTSKTNTQVERSSVNTFDLNKYIKNEFFNADHVVFTKVTNLYRELYGYAAYKYLLETFYSWKSGSVGLSRQTVQRILECVPKFLTNEKRFYILKCEIINFIETTHFKRQNKEISVTELNTLFESYAKEINNLNHIQLRWFVGKGIFTELELQQLLSVFKYALNKKLNLSFRQVQSDLMLIKTKLSVLKQGSFNAKYHIDFLTSIVDISNIKHTPLVFTEINARDIELEGIFKQYAEQYILEELMKMNFSEQQGEVNHYIKSKDLDFFLEQYKEILDRDQEASLKSEFKGEGGKLNLFLEVKSLKKIQATLFISVVKAAFYTGIFSSAIIIIFAFELYKAHALLFLGGFIVGGMLIGGIGAEFKTIKNSIVDLKRYGK